MSVRSVIDSPVCGANCDYNSYVSVQKYNSAEQMTFQVICFVYMVFRLCASPR